MKVTIARCNKQNKYVSAAFIFNVLKQKIGSSLQVSGLSNLGREFKNIDGLENKKTRFCDEYKVVRK